MRVPRVHVSTPLAIGTELALPEVPARHLARVLRLAPGARVTLFDGSGGEYAAVLTEVTKRTVRARPEAFSPREIELPYPVLLAQAISLRFRLFRHSSSPLLTVTCYFSIQLPCRNIQAPRRSFLESV